MPAAAPAPMPTVAPATNPHSGARLGAAAGTFGPALDTAPVRALLRWAGPERTRALLDDWVADAAAHLGRARRARRDGDMARVAVVARSLRTHAGHLGVRDLQGAAGRLACAALAGISGEVDARLAELAGSQARLRRALHAARNRAA